MRRASDGLLAIYVRPPGSPDLAQRLCSAASSLRCRTAAEDGSVAELERSPELVLAEVSRAEGPRVGCKGALQLHAAAM